MTALTLYTKLETLPPGLKKEAMDFIDFLFQKSKKKKENHVIKPVFGSAKGKYKGSRKVY